MRNHNQDLKVQDITWIQKMIAGPEEVDGLDWVDEDELTGEEIKDISQLSGFGITEQSLNGQDENRSPFLVGREQTWQSQRQKRLLHRLFLNQGKSWWIH